MPRLDMTLKKKRSTMLITTKSNFLRRYKISNYSQKSLFHEHPFDLKGIGAWEGISGTGFR